MKDKTINKKNSGQPFILMQEQMIS